jgi:hypothetical protein
MHQHPTQSHSRPDTGEGLPEVEPKTALVLATHLLPPLAKVHGSRRSSHKMYLILIPVKCTDADRTKELLNPVLVKRHQVK